MNSRSTTSTVTFARPFHIAGYEGELPAGDYEVIVEEDLLQGLSFEAFRRSGTFLVVHEVPGRWGAVEMRPIDPRDLDAALARDQGTPERA